MGLFEEDLSFFFVGVQHSRRSTIYFGAMPFIALYIRSSILYAIHCLIGSQGNWRSTGVIHVCSELWVLDTRWVAQFWTYCSLSRTDHGNPYRKALQGHLPVLSVPGVGHLQILHCPGSGHLTTPGPFPSFWHACGFLSEYNYTEGFAGKKADWLICQGQD